jgi:hypothetical protein
MAKIVTVYNTARHVAELRDMSYIRWFRMSEALARLGHSVDIATAGFTFRAHQGVIALGPRLRRVPISRVRWDEYDVVKTLFHQGFDTLRRFGGADHPFIIAKVGSVVAATDREGIYFHGRTRKRLFDTQARIHETARYVTVLTTEAHQLWVEQHGHRDNILLVPGAVDADPPPPGPDPYPDGRRPRCIFSGNVYASNTDANRVLAEKLNEVGSRLKACGARLFVAGVGSTRRFDDRYVTRLGSFPYLQSWDHIYHADVGILVAPGTFLHNNESTKVYHYLRAGLPVASEAGFPNDHVLRESGLALVAPNGDMAGVAELAMEATRRTWDRDRAIRYILENHTWDRRAAIYHGILQANGVPCV